jgi:hypothetical protein
MYLQYFKFPALKLCGVQIKNKFYLFIEISVKIYIFIFALKPKLRLLNFLVRDD